MSKNPLTLLITIHSQFESVIFFHTLIERSGFDKKKVMFAFDCNKNDIPNNIIDILEKENYSFYCPDENIGKLWLVIKATSLITTPYFKIIDQDDSIYFDNLPKIERKLEKLNGNELIKHKALKIKKKSNLFFQSADENVIKKQVKEGKDPHFVQGTNCNIIYPTKQIEKMNKIKFTRQHFHNDILLSNFIVGMGLPKVKINDKFYIQFHQRGQTSEVSVNRSNCIPELYDNYKKINDIYNEFKFKRIMFGSTLLHKIYIKNFTLWYLKDIEATTAKDNYNKAIHKLNELGRS